MSLILFTVSLIFSSIRRSSVIICFGTIGIIVCEFLEFSGIPFTFGEVFCDVKGVWIGVISLCGESDDTDNPIM